MVLKDTDRGLGYINPSDARNEVSRLGTRIFAPYKRSVWQYV
jgi:hypothetical protein